MTDWPAGLPDYFHDDYDPHAFCVPRQHLEDAEAEIKALRAEVERLRERLDALASEFEKEAAFAYDGWQEEKDDYLEGVYRAFRHAAEKVRALAERGGNCG